MRETMHYLIAKTLRKYRALRETRARYGLPAVIADVALWALRKVVVCRTSVVFTRTTSNTAEDLGPPSASFRFLDNSSSEAAQVWPEAAIQAPPPGPDVRPFFGWQEGRLVFVSWVARSSFCVPQRFEVSLPAGWAYVGNCVTHPDARGQGIYPLALQTLCRRLHREEVAWLCLTVERENRASLRGVARARFSPLATASVLALGPFKWVRWKWVRAPADTAGFGVRRLGVSDRV